VANARNQHRGGGGGQTPQARADSARQLDAIPKLAIHSSPEGGAFRSYFVFRGSIDAASALEFNGWNQAPNLLRWAYRGRHRGRHSVSHRLPHGYTLRGLGSSHEQLGFLG
jgi:hypothetical protein